MAAMHIQPATQARIARDRGKPAGGKGEAIRKCRIVQRMRRCQRHRAGNVRDAIMHHAILEESRVGRVSLDARLSKQPPWSIEISTRTAPFFMPRNICLVTSFGAAAPGISTAPITASAEKTVSSIAAAEAKRRLCPPLKQFVELAQARERAVEDRHICAKAGRHPRGLGSRDAAAEHRDPCRRNPRNAAKQNAAAAVLALKSNARRLGREPSGDFAHRCEKGQALAPGPVTVS